MLAAPATPYVLLLYQQRWLADHTPVKLIEKSRRVGLSWSEAADCVLLASQTQGQDCWYVGYTKDMASEFIRDCGDWAKEFNTAVSEIQEHEELFEDGDEQKSILAFTVRFASGYRITALSSSPRNLRGKQGRIIIDEAAFHPDLAELLKAALAMLIWGGQVHIISTHNGTENPFNQLIEEVRAGKKKYSLHRVTLDDALQEGLYRRICLVRKIDWTAEGEAQWRQELVDRYGDGADEELFCIPSKGTGAWLTRTLIEERMVSAPVGARHASPLHTPAQSPFEPLWQVLRYKGPIGMELWADSDIEAAIAQFIATDLQPNLNRLNPLLRSGFGLDFGRHADLTVLAPFQLMPNLQRRIPFLLELSNVPFKAQALFLFFIVDALPRFSHGMLDAGGNGAYLAEVAKQRYGAHAITEVKFTEGWYRDNTAPVKAAFEDGSIALPKDSAVLDDLSAFRLIKGVPRIPDLRVKDAQGNKRHGDAGIAILLAHAASRAEYVEVDFDSAESFRPSGMATDYLGAMHGY